MKKSLIDDVSLDVEDSEGKPILFANPDIRKMMNLAKVNEKDVFFDLGCGYGQNIKIALTEYNVKHAIGFENNLERNKIATKRMKKLSKIGIFEDRWQIRNEDFEKDLLENKITDVSIHDATVIFYGLDTSNSLFKKFDKQLKKGCRLICYYNCLFPEIIPDKNGVDFPFFVFTYPFKKTQNEKEWLRTIVQKEKSIFSKNKKPDIKEMWDELMHDYDVDGNRYDIKYYKKQLKNS